MKLVSVFFCVIFLVGANLSIVISEGQRLEENGKFLKVYFTDRERFLQVVEMGVDVVELGFDYLKVLATAEQFCLLEGASFQIEELSMSELFDASVIGKVNAGLYHTYAEVVAELFEIEEAYGGIAKTYVIGKSIEGRDIMAIKISDNPEVEAADEPEVLYMGCHHAREWISVEIPMYLAHYLVDNYGIDSNITRSVEERETWIVPVVNPDGLVYSQTVYTMWRKNKRDNNKNNVFERWYDGVDLNRNHGYKWGYDDFGSSPYPGAEDYRGKYAFSEPESQAIRDLALGHDFVFSISYHSYGELVIYPWGYVNEDTFDDRLFTDVAARMACFNGYMYGNPKDNVIYNTNGGSDDWLYGCRGTIAYTFELGTMFIPPETEIEQIWLQNKYASLYLLQIADNPYQIYPSIRVYTDKAQYSIGDVMKVGIDLENNHDVIDVGVGIWVDMPNGGKYWVVREPLVTIPRGFSYSNSAWKSYVLPLLQSGDYYWHAIIVDPSTYYVLCESVSPWVFSGIASESECVC